MFDLFDEINAPEHESPHEHGLDFYTVRHYIERIPMSEITKRQFGIGDEIYIPVFGVDTKFVVEGIDSGSNDVYFVSRDIVLISNIERIGDALKEIEDSIPKELLSKMNYIEHLCEMQDGTIVRNVRKITIPTELNVTWSNNRVKENGICFSGFFDNMSRCKAYSGVVKEWWLDTPAIGDTERRLYVGSHGDANLSLGRHNFLGIVPCFSIRQEFM